MTRIGSVHLVGAGPGDVSLLTLRGAELLGQAEVVVHDGLVNPAILQLAHPKAEIIYGGKHDRAKAVGQSKLNELLAARAREGRRVVRLKGGDPYVFGRGGEEAEYLAAAGIPFEVVPGVSSAEAVPNYAGIPLTHRQYCSSYTVITGHEDPSRESARVDWAALARNPGTLVILMGLGRLRQITDQLMAHGRAGDIPVAVVRDGTTWRQQVVEGTLRSIAAQVDGLGIESPALVVIGEVVRLRSKLDWFGRRPLQGQRIVVTQPRDFSAVLCKRLRDLGAEVREVPAFRFGPPADPEPVRRAMRRLNEFDWVVLSSPVSVSAFVSYFFESHADWREMGPVRLAAYGPQTAQALESHHLKVNAVPVEHQGPPLAAALGENGSVSGKRILLLRMEGVGAKVPDYLQAQGALVEDVACYGVEVDIEDSDGAAAGLVSEGGDWVTFAGFPDVKQFQRRVDLRELRSRHPQLKLAAIGPKTSDQLAELGLQADVQAVNPTVESLVEGLVQAVAAGTGKNVDPVSAAAPPPSAVSSPA